MFWGPLSNTGTLQDFVQVLTSTKNDSAGLSWQAGPSGGELAWFSRGFCRPPPSARACSGQRTASGGPFRAGSEPGCTLPPRRGKPRAALQVRKPNWPLPCSTEPYFSGAGSSSTCPALPCLPQFSPLVLSINLSRWEQSRRRCLFLWLWSEVH